MVKPVAYLLSIALIFCVAPYGLAQSPGTGAAWAGTWGGAMVTEAGMSGVQIVLTRDGDRWKAAMKLRPPGEEISPTVNDLTINGEQISFAADLGRLIAKFSGRLEGDKLSGAVEVFQAGNKVRSGAFTLVRGGQMPAAQQAGGQVADDNFDTKVVNPGYRTKGPRVLFDEAHNNFHTASGRYKPFADLIANDGYQVVPNKQPFSKASLKDYRVLVISNALGAERMNDPSASNSAFTEEESDAVRDWVKDGGSLLLIADHAPMGSANQSLAQRFGVNMSKGYTADPQNHDPESGNQGFIIYTRESGRLADHPVTRGRNDSERVNRIMTFTGQSIKGPDDVTPFLKLSDTAFDAMPDKTLILPRLPVALRA